MPLSSPSPDDPRPAVVERLQHLDAWAAATIPVCADIRDDEISSGVASRSLSPENL